LAELVEQLRGRYERLLFDSPPIIGVSDASLLAAAMDGVMLLIQHRRNPASMTLRAQQTLAGARTKLYGVILNQVPGDSGEDYGYYTHNYAYDGDGSGAGGGRRSAGRTKAGGAQETTSGDHLDLD